MVCIVGVCALVYSHSFIISSAFVGAYELDGHQIQTPTLIRALTLIQTGKFKSVGKRIHM